ncbi:hypothetical protein OB905_12830 [Halobacteria archaeon AArc-dxtr1]|nr:hypothetical protein [Halobacteria archaeon AArc-dxtr1]
MERFDTVAVVGIAAILLASTWLGQPLAAAVFGGFLLSLSTWQLYRGRPWEAVAWFAWVVAALSVVVFPPGGLAFWAGFLGPVVIGIVVLFASRSGARSEPGVNGDESDAERAANGDGS